MTNREDKTASRQVNLNDDDVAFLMYVLRDPSRPQPLTTQQLVDALRGRTVK